MDPSSPPAKATPDPACPDVYDLSALIASRICHDLVNPLGAIGNGVELLAMTGAATGPEIELITSSVTQASARVRLFRVAFGASGPDHRIGRSEVLSTLADLSCGTRLSVDWDTETDLGRDEVKLAFLALLSCESLMPYGGAIRVTAAGTDWTVTGTSARLRVDPALWALLAGTADTPPTPAQVHLWLLPHEAARMGRALRIDQSDAAVSLTF